MSISRRFAGAWLALLIILSPAFAVAASATPAPVELDRTTTELSLTPHIGYYHDPSASMDLAAVTQVRQQGGFAALPGGRDSFGFQPGAFWFHARVVNTSSDQTRWLLVQQYALSDDIQVHARQSDGRVVEYSGGDHRPFESRSIRYRHPNFWLDLPTGEPVDIYVRIQSESSMQVPLALYTPTAFTEKSRDSQLGIGIYYGILLALFFYNLVLWLTTRDSSYFWYVIHLTAFGLVLFTLNGLGFEYLWPNSPWLADKSVPLSICLAQIGVQQFARKFLDLHERWRLGDRVGLSLIAFFVVLAVVSMLVPYRISTPIASASVFISIGWIAVETIVVMRLGYRPARLFLLAWGMFLIGTAMFTAVAFALLPKTFVTEYGVQIGSALEMLLLSVALGYRYAALRNENERIVREAKAQLEQKVEQRTSELRTALAQLNDAHIRLRESSQRDALTGLNTRSHFYERLEPMLKQSMENKQPLSILMIDLDHFKDINDRYGHLAGDACLRWAAHMIGQALRPHQGLVARFGGEEFVAALPGYSLEAATQAAEQVRHQLSSRPCDHIDGLALVTTSIGVHEVNFVSNDGIDDALELADQALYKAKAGGRNCVRTSSVEA
jgi:diguanylate cyclase (GGDEF)-like protein